MRISTARSIVIFGSMCSIVVIVCVLMLGAAVNWLPLDIEHANGILKIALPPFFGYLGAACHYVFAERRGNDRRDIKHLGQLLLGSFAVYYTIVVVALAAFVIINSPTLSIPQNANRFSTDSLETFFAVAMSFLAATTGVIAAYLFAAESRARQPGHDP